MAFRVKLDAFRCFKETDWITVRPLTLLIGKNSSGKSSFLAAVRYMLNSLGSAATASFNQEPFFLGAFDQIAHFRRGKLGRARSFYLAIEIPPEFFRAQKKEGVQSPMRFKLHFDSVSGQPANTKVTINYGNSHLEAKLGESSHITLSEREQAQLSLFHQESKPDSFSIPFLTLDTMKFLLNDISYIVRKPRKESAPLRGDEDPDDPLMHAARRAEEIGRVLRNVARRLQGGVIASAPVRSRPARTYEPVEEMAGSEGSDIPLLLARLSATDKSEWDRIKGALDDFGRASGLFDNISIRRLGKNPSDPFQVLVNISGPPSNLIDVGYGVSQALPLVTELVKNGNSKIFLYQQPEVHLHPSAQAELGTLLGTAVAKKKHTVLIETHSDFILDRIRMDIRDKKTISHHDAIILYFEKEGLDSKIYEIGFDETGQLLNAPPCYREFFIREQLRSLKSVE
jgi:predicted ATPase